MVTNYYKLVMFIVSTMLIINQPYLFGQIKAGKSSCANADFSEGNFTNWEGWTSVYPFNTPGANLPNPNNGIDPPKQYYYNTGIVNGRHTIITQATPDPFTCGNVLTIPPGEKSAVRLGNGGVGPWGNGVAWQREGLNYTFQITPANALLIYKYAVILQDPQPVHAKTIRPRFIVTIKDGAGKLIDPVCGQKEDYADATVPGYRNCSETEAKANGGQVQSPGDIVYRAWTIVGVDLRKFIGQNVTISFETWDCGQGGHFGYAYLTARCDSLGIIPSACSANGAVRLTAPEGFAYRWSTGQTTRVIDILNAKPGDEVTVELTTISGCKTSLSTKIYPMFTKANFKQSADSVCANTPINFTDSSYSIYTNNNSNVPIIDYRWSFGDGTYATTKDATHAYKKEGTYKITLSVMNQNGCADSITKIVKVFPSPLAKFYFDDICINGTAHFWDASTKVGGGVVTRGWLWTFGDDNSTSDLQNPSHVFKSSGTFPVTLSISDLGCEGDTTAMIKIFPLPKPDFTTSPVCVGNPTVFIDKSDSGDPAAVIDSWMWSFGDKSALYSQQNPVHTYGMEGKYTTLLVVKTKLGCSDIIIKEVVVKPLPTAKFSATPLCLGEPVRFTDLSTPAGEITGWYWSYNDRGNNHGTVQNPQFQYDTSALYRPKLKVTSKDGCTDSTTILLNIPPLPQINFDADRYESCVPLITNLLDFSFSSSDKIVSWNWNFGDGVTDTARNATHTYSVPGTYDVSLTITTANSCKASYTWKEMMKAYPLPKAGFIFSPEQPTESENTVKFYDRATETSFWSWDFGDIGSLGSGSIEQNPYHTYKSPGTFTIWQFVTSPHGCRDSISNVITIKPNWAFYVPNTFTPNGNGTNEGFIPKGYNITEFQMWIFDRWGNMIYTTDKTTSPDTAIPWNGKANGGSKIAQEDVYVWVVELKDINFQPHRYIGHVTLVR